MHRRFVPYALVILAVLVLAGALYPLATDHASAQGSCITFLETGKSVCDRFLQYWSDNGRVPQQGYPISDVIGEVSSVDGKTYTVQYFERAVFEYHPENPPPYDVLLSLLGSFAYSATYPNGAPNQTPDTSPGSQLFPQTGYRVGGAFLQYWQLHGGVAQQGYPISNVFVETSRLNGKPYQVQYFERAVLELHPENPPLSRVLLSQLGALRYRDKYGAAPPTLPPPLPVPPAIPPAPPPQPTTVAPLPDPTQEPSSSSVVIVKAPGKVGRGSNASVTAKTSPNKPCSIYIAYDTGPPLAAGLDDKTSNGSGLVSWTWTVGTHITPGTWPVYITCAGDTSTTYVTVVNVP
jgi:hypothetical protein